MKKKPSPRKKTSAMPKKTARSTKIFISHAHADKSIADAFVDLLQTGLAINAQRDVFCSSLEGLGVPYGDVPTTTIAKALQTAKAIVLLVTDTYLKRDFCLHEAGAAILFCKPTFCLMVPPVTYSNLKGALASPQVRSIDGRYDLTELKDQLAETLNIGHAPHARWEAKRDRFLKEFADEAKPTGLIPVAVAQPSVVSASGRTARKQLIGTWRRENEENGNLVTMQLHDDGRCHFRMHVTTSDTFESQFFLLLTGGGMDGFWVVEDQTLRLSLQESAKGFLSGPFGKLVVTTLFNLCGQPEQRIGHVDASRLILDDCEWQRVDE
jgi:hypothetical protein